MIMAVILRTLGASLGVDDVSCAGHTLQLCINNGLKAHANIGRLISCGRRLVGHFRKSVVATKALELKQEQLCVQKHRLIQSVCTQWNSVYEMTERLLEQRWAVCAVLSDRHYTPLPEARTSEIRDEDWRLAEELLACLKPLQIATTVLSSETNTSLSSVLPIVTALVKRHLELKDDDSLPVKEFKKVTASELKRRFLPSDEVTRSHLATALDPRYKALKFLTPDERVAVYDKLTSLIAEQQPAAKKRRRSNDAGEESSSAVDFLLGACSDDEAPTIEDSEKCEFTHYISLPSPSHNSDPDQWWKQYSSNFPILSSLAKAYLGTTSKSVPSERIFSAAGNIVNCKRNCLLPSNVNILIFLNKNL